MKTTKVFLSGAFFFAVIFFLCLSCRKNVQDPAPGNVPVLPDSTAALQTNQDSSGYIPLPENYSMNCPGSPSYGDSIIYPSGSYRSPDYMMSPINNPAPGRYFSWPIGLVINDSTGTIDVTKSETGLRYYIGYVKKGSQDTCLNTLIIAGAAYMDSIYTQSNHRRSIVQPYFNANSGINNICGFGEDGHCLWDLSNNATMQKIQVDRNTGIIDLDQTLQNGAFGRTPVNGTTLNAVIYYVLDAHNPALQSLQIQLMYYDHASSVPLALQEKIQTRSTSANGNQIFDSGGPSAPRPPIIIITRAL